MSYSPHLFSTPVTMIIDFQSSISCSILNHFQTEKKGGGLVERKLRFDLS